MTVLYGANGSGKTTLLRILAGLARPNTGAVLGRPARIAVVPDRLVAPRRMTAESYLRHHGRIRGLSSAQATRRAANLADQLAITPGLDVPMEHLSKGNLQKVALSQAFLAPVDLLALDEPRTALDARANKALDGLIADARRDGTIVTLSDPVLGAVPVGGRRYDMTDGRLRAIEALSTPAANAMDVIVVLQPRSTTHSVPLLATLADLDLTQPDDPSTVRVVIGAGESDDFLAWALRTGWSVLSVERGEPPAPRTELRPS